MKKKKAESERSDLGILADEILRPVREREKRHQILGSLAIIGKQLARMVEPTYWAAGGEVHAKKYNKPLRAARVAYASIRKGANPKTILTNLRKTFSPGIDRNFLDKIIQDFVKSHTKDDTNDGNQQEGRGCNSYGSHALLACPKAGQNAGLSGGSQEQRLPKEYPAHPESSGTEGQATEAEEGCVTSFHGYSCCRGKTES